MPDLVLHSGNEYISDYIRTHHCWEPVLSEVITELVRAAASTHTFVDVGANLGYFSIWVASQPGNMEVVAWEPIHENLQLLRENVARNQVEQQVTILPYAAGCCGNRLAKFYLNNTNMGVCSSVPIGLVCGTQWVQERDLLTAINELSGKRGTLPWILKVDVEEQELDLLTSFSPAAWAKIDVLILEVAPWHAIQLLKLLQTHFNKGLDLGDMLAGGSMRVIHNHCETLESIHDWNWDKVQYTTHKQANVVLFKDHFIKSGLQHPTINA